MANPTQQPAEPGDEDVKAVGQLRKAREKLRQEIGRVVVGQGPVLDHLLAALLCRGHALMVGVPGLGKTLMAKTIAQTLQMSFNRIQFTPDLMPSDIIGTDVIEEDPQTGRRRLEFIEGPLFTHFLLADEINRAPPKTQSALLQAMQEQEVSVGRRSYRLEAPFFVIATQNPIEQEGTYPLPEAQLDRFMFNIAGGLPQPGRGSLDRQEHDSQPRRRRSPPCSTRPRWCGFSKSCAGCRSPTRWCATRSICHSPPGPRAGRKNDPRIQKFLTYGASPRASQYLILGAKAMAVLSGRFHVDFADVRAVALPVLRHRLVLNFHARAEGIDADDLIRRLIEIVPTG